jgi:ribosomal protein L11 methyltransferase
MSQTQFTLHTTSEGVDWVRSLLAQQGFAGQLRVSRYAATSDSHLAEQPEWAYTLVLQVPDPLSSRAHEQLHQLLSPLHRTGMATPLESQTESESGASSLWHPVGARFLIGTAEAEVPEQLGDRRVIRLQSSLAFGSGFHPATNLALELLERYVQPGMQVLDLGCGSGVLSIAMAHLGATVLAVDNDAIAVAASETAVGLNQVADQVRVMLASLGRGSDLGHWMGSGLTEAIPAIDVVPQFDLIAANVLGRIHVTLATDYRGALRQQLPHGGSVITAGFTDDYAVEVAQALQQAGFERFDQARSQEWVAFAHRVSC